MFLSLYPSLQNPPSPFHLFFTKQPEWASKNKPWSHHSPGPRLPLDPLVNQVHVPLHGQPGSVCSGGAHVGLTLPHFPHCSPGSAHLPAKGSGFPASSCSMFSSEKPNPLPHPTSGPLHALTIFHVTIVIIYLMSISSFAGPNAPWEHSVLSMSELSTIYVWVKYIRFFEDLTPRFCKDLQSIYYLSTMMQPLIQP